MCTSEKQAPKSVAAALAAMDDILGYLRDPGAASLLASELGGTLEAMGVLSGKFAAVRAGILSRFDAERAYTDYADPPVMPMAAQQPWSRVSQGRC
jgi:hypothetical protein